jgi:Holliday junction resolvase RusA-like endonuclease
MPELSAAWERQLSPATLAEVSEADWDAQLARFTVPDDPVSKARVRYQSKARPYTPAKTKSAEEAVRWAFLASNGTKNDVDELGVRIQFYCSTRQRRDIDNLAKLVLDACNGFAWKDDAQIVELNLTLERGVPDPRTEVEIYVAKVRARDCQACKTPLTAKQIALNAAFCSKACYAVAQNKGHWRRCTGCGKDVYRQAEKASARSKRLLLT